MNCASKKNYKIFATLTNNARDGHFAGEVQTLIWRRLMLLRYSYSKTKMKLQIINVTAILLFLVKSEVEEHVCGKSKNDAGSLSTCILLMLITFNFSMWFFDDGVTCETSLMCIRTFSIVSEYRTYNTRFRKQFAFVFRWKHLKKKVVCFRNFVLYILY
jgi:hypothetical protein